MFENLPKDPRRKEIVSDTKVRPRTVLGNGVGTGVSIVSRVTGVWGSSVYGSRDPPEDFGESGPTPFPFGTCSLPVDDGEPFPP